MFQYLSQLALLLLSLCLDGLLMRTCLALKRWRNQRVSGLDLKSTLLWIRTARSALQISDFHDVLVQKRRFAMIVQLRFKSDFSGLRAPDVLLLPVHLHTGYRKFTANLLAEQSRTPAIFSARLLCRAYPEHFLNIS